MQIRDPLTGVCVEVRIMPFSECLKKKKLTSHVLDQFKVSHIL